jgi:hypothetical protein
VIHFDVVETEEKLFFGAAFGVLSGIKITSQLRSPVTALMIANANGNYFIAKELETEFPDIREEDSSRNCLDVFSSGSTEGISHLLLLGKLK